MKKIYAIILAAILLVVVILGVTSCNQMIDTTFSFERVIISLPNGEVIEGKVTSWTDFDDGDMLQVKIDGKVYLTHSSNVVLISE